jgi:hypothetical protein
MANEPESELEKFDAAIKKIVLVSNKELELRGRKWKKQRKAKKRAKP